MQRFVYGVMAAAFMVVSCSERHPGDQQQEKPRALTLPETREKMVAANRDLARMENDQMDVYERNHRIAFVRTPSGIRYYVYHHGHGDSIRTGTLITIDYEVSLLDGTPAYSSKTSGPRTFEVGYEDIESGVHHAVQYLRKGDKALILIPSPLAHGLLGDMKKIPPQMPIVYDLQVRE